MEREALTYQTGPVYPWINLQCSPEYDLLLEESRTVCRTRKYVKYVTLPALERENASLPASPFPPLLCPDYIDRHPSIIRPACRLATANYLRLIIPVDHAYLD